LFKEYAVSNNTSKMSFYCADIWPQIYTTDCERRGFWSR